MGAYCGLTYGQMLRIGGEPFSMTAAGLRLSSKANAVSQLHGETAGRMWQDISGASEIIAITNGVHNETWQDPELRKAYNEKSDIWKPHMRVKRELFGEIYRRNNILPDENILTIVFGRRAATYKRSDLILRGGKVIEELLLTGKLQVVFSGKAHPNDLEGKKTVSNLYEMSVKYPNCIVFIQDYDMKIGKLMTRGCDVWLNNPIRPMEASGTSGMKAAMNGVLNFSTLDGWWPEGCVDGVNGWQIGEGYQGDGCDKVDSGSLFSKKNAEGVL